MDKVSGMPGESRQQPVTLSASETTAALVELNRRDRFMVPL